MPRNPIHIGLYVDDFIFFSESDAEKQHVYDLLSKHLHLVFMRCTYLFLSTNFEWVNNFNRNPSVHLTQKAFVEHISAQFSLKDYNRTPNMTPHHSGCPIDSIIDP